jgi:hypothetical protein
MREDGITWPGMYNDISNFIASCPVCQRTRSRDPRKKLKGAGFSVKSKAPGIKIAIDLMGPLIEDVYGYKYVLVIIDAMSRFIDLYPLKSKEADEVARKLLEYFNRSGQPKEIRSDLGTEFMNSIIGKIFNLAHINHITSLESSHEENGLVERSIREIRQRLNQRMLEMDKDTPWSIQLFFVLRMINSHVHSDTGFAPATLRFGLYNTLTPRLFQPIEGEGEEAMSPAAWLDRMVQTQEELVQTWEETFQRQQLTIQEQSPATQVPIGSWVLIEVPYKLKSDIFGSNREGPYEVVSQTGNKIGVNNPTNGKTFYVHISRISIYRKRPREDPIQTALKFKNYYRIEEILSHEFRPASSRSIKNLFLKLTWKGYDGIYEECLGKNISLQRTEEFVTYARRFPELQRFIITEIASERLLANLDLLSQNPHNPGDLKELRLICGKNVYTYHRNDNRSIEDILTSDSSHFNNINV